MQDIMLLIDYLYILHIGMTPLKVIYEKVPGPFYFRNLKEMEG